MRTTRMTKRILLAIVATAAGLMLPVLPAQANDMTSASLQLSDGRANVSNVTYTFTMSNLSATNLGCVTFQFKTVADMTGTVPAGLNFPAPAISASSTLVTAASWTPTWTAGTGTLDIKHATTAAPGTQTNATVVLTGVTSASTANTSYFVQIKTFSGSGACTGQVDSTTIAYIHTDGQAVSAIVDPTLAFAVAGKATACNGSTVPFATATSTTLDFGRVTSSTDKVLAQDLTVSTNGTDGYVVTVRSLTNGGSPDGNPKTAANDTIANTAGTNATPAAFSADEAFGYTTNSSTLSGTNDRFTDGGNEWAAMSTTAGEIARNTGPVSNETTCVGYQIGISNVTEAGTYTTTVIYAVQSIY